MNFYSSAPRRPPGRSGLLPEFHGRAHYHSDVPLLEGLFKR